MKTKPQVLFLSHGGGPMPLLGDAEHSEMLSCLRSIAADIPKPSAILVISAHWEERIPSLTAAATPPLIYDYYGFPEESYRISYPCLGEPLLAQQVHASLQKAGIAANCDTQRGFDHGLFIPLKIMYPEADIPCVQLSLVESLDPAEHISIGRALQKLDYGNLLIIGSGFSFHNFKAFFAPPSADSTTLNESFENWLIETCTNPDLSEADRSQRLTQWQDAPAARYCHPREEHLLPLHVCYGLANTACTKHFELQILNKKASMSLWR